MNEKWLVVGFRSVNFKDKQTGNPVNGFSLYLQRDPLDDRVQGQEVDKIFISSEYVRYSPELGDEIVLIYNKYGKISSIQVV